MLADGAWPEVDEDSLTSRADNLTNTLRQVTSALQTWLHEQSELFASWSGDGAEAASTKVAASVESLQAQQRDIARAILWHRYAAATVAATKMTITFTVEATGADIATIEATAEINPDAQSQIQSLKNAAHSQNLAAVAEAAEVVAPGAVPMPDSEIGQLIDQAARPPLAAAPQRPNQQAPRSLGTNGSMPLKSGQPGERTPQHSIAETRPAQPSSADSPPATTNHSMGEARPVQPNPTSAPLADANHSSAEARPAGPQPAPVSYPTPTPPPALNWIPQHPAHQEHHRLCL